MFWKGQTESCVYVRIAALTHLYLLAAERGRAYESTILTETESSSYFVDMACWQPRIGVKGELGDHIFGQEFIFTLLLN